MFAASIIDTVSKIREIAIIDLLERASIAQILVKHYNRSGLSTLQDQVLGLNVPSTVTVARGAVPARCCLKAYPARTKPRDLQKSTNIIAAAALYRIRKVCDPLAGLSY